MSKIHIYTHIVDGELVCQIPFSDLSRAQDMLWKSLRIALDKKLHGDDLVRQEIGSDYFLVEYKGEKIYGKLATFETA